MNQPNELKNVTYSFRFCYPTEVKRLVSNLQKILDQDQIDGFTVTDKDRETAKYILEEAKSSKAYKCRSGIANYTSLKDCKNKNLAIAFLSQVENAIQEDKGSKPEKNKLYSFYDFEKVDLLSLKYLYSQLNFITLQKDKNTTKEDICVALCLCDEIRDIIKEKEKNIKYWDPSNRKEGDLYPIEILRNFVPLKKGATGAYDQEDLQEMIKYMLNKRQQEEEEKADQRQQEAPKSDQQHQNPEQEEEKASPLYAEALTMSQIITSEEVIVTDDQIKIYKDELTKLIKNYNEVKARKYQKPLTSFLLFGLKASEYITGVQYEVRNGSNADQNNMYLINNDTLVSIIKKAKDTYLVSLGKIAKEEE